jgi:hypothetical protein
MKMVRINSIHVFGQVNSEKKISVGAVQMELKVRDLFGNYVAHYK